ncbi:MAG: DUF2523 domain-containing protein [Burkholderiales bacterium]|nr:DUF2523 domain-containing protein [Burkholderiales bacterium]
MNWATWLMSLAAPIAKRVAVALGFGYVSFEGAALVLENAFASAQGALGGLVGEAAAILARAGMFDAMAIASGALVASLSWVMLRRFALVSS